MIELLRDFLFKKEAFVGYLRFLLIGLGVAFATGQVPLECLPAWVKTAGVLLAAFGGFLRAGERNPTTETR